MSAKSRNLMLWILATTVLLGGVVQADLVGWWKLDETAGNVVVADSSGNGLDGALQGAAAIVNDAQRGPVFQENDAAANYISIVDPRGLLNFSATGPHQGSATLAAWVKSNGNWTSHDTIFSQGEWDDGIGLSIKADTSPAGQLWLAGDGTHAVTFRSDVAVPTGAWHHVAATFAYDGTTTVVTLYLDGETTGFAQGDGRIPGRVTAPVGGISRIGLEDRSGSGASPRWPFNGSIDDVAVFDTALSQAEVQAAMQGIGVQRGAASNPKPTDGVDDVLRDAVLSWTPGPFAATHDVYFGANQADVASATLANPLGVSISAGQDANTFDPAGLLEFGQTYYWRVDEVNAAPDFKVFAGEVWSFTVEPYAYPIGNIQATASSSFNADSGPERTVDGTGLDADLHGTADGTMWLSLRNAPAPAWIQYEFDRIYKLDHMLVWNFNSGLEMILNVGVKEVTIEYSLDGIEWAALPGVEPFEQAPGAPGYASDTTVDFRGAVARYVRLTLQSNWGGNAAQFGLSEVRFYHVPVSAREPEPAPASTDISPEVVLSWRAGREAVSHRVYLSADSNAVAEGTALAGTVSESRYAASGLDLGVTYYWKVVEVNEAASPAAWESDIWSFSTVDQLVIEDFESYDDADNRIFDAWLDGYQDNSNGSTVGYIDALNGTFGERTIIHGGKQSMPLYYDNSSVPISEAQRTWTTAQNWTTHGADTLTLYYRGVPTGFLETTDGHILMNGVGTDIYGTSDQGRFVYKQLTGDGSIIARVDRLDRTDAWAKAGVMIRSSLEAGSAWALALASPANGTHFQARLTTGVGATSDTALNTTATPLPAEQTSVQIPLWVKLERKGNLFTVYYATGEAPTTWIANPWNPQTIPMSAQVYIGLAVTSHAAGVVTQAEFSNISVTGNVTGSWQSADLGIDQPAGNLPDPLYLTVEDTAGRKATVVNADPLAVAAGAWMRWSIPLNEFNSAGVKTDSIKKMTIGVGDQSKPASKAGGLIYIDDIGFGRPADE